MKPYSLDLRQRVLNACDRGLSTREVATKYEVSESWVRRLKQRRRETNSIAPKPQRYGPLPSWNEHAERITAEVAARPDITLAELQERLEGRLSVTTLWRALQTLGLTVKKKS